MGLHILPSSYAAKAVVPLVPTRFSFVRNEKKASLFGQRQALSLHFYEGNLVETILF